MIEKADNRGGLIVFYKMRILCGKILSYDGLKICVAFISLTIDWK